MNKFEIKSLGIQELDQQELLNSNGGGVIKNFFKNLVAVIKCDCVSDEPWTPNYDVLKGPKI